MAVMTGEKRKQVKPLDAAALQQLALAYAGRYATTRAKLADYLIRKLRERGWRGEKSPEIKALVERMATLGYVDDKAFAEAKAQSLGRRGYGPRRVGSALFAAGIDEADTASAREIASSGAWQAALRFAQRRRIGPFATSAPDPAGREKAVAAMLRAGHSMDFARKLALCVPGAIPDEEE